MIVNSYETSNRKNVIREYINKLTQDERTEAFKILEEFQLNGINALQFFDTRQLRNLEEH